MDATAAPFDMRAQDEKPASTKKQFGKGEREVPHHSQKASKYYPTEDVPQPRKPEDDMAEGELQAHGTDIEHSADNIALKVRKSIRPAKPRASLQPGTVLILLAGRFRGKRVILLKHLPQGVLLVTGPFKVNGVPLRRVNARYVIATQTKVDLSGIDDSVVEKVGSADYFAREKKPKKAGEDAFFKQGEKPEKKQVSGTRAEDQKSVDKALLSNLKKEPFLMSYLGSTFSLRKGDRPHEMVF